MAGQIISNPTQMAENKLEKREMLTGQSVDTMATTLVFKWDAFE